MNSDGFLLFFCLSYPPLCQNFTVEHLKYDNIALYLTDEHRNMFSRLRQRRTGSSYLVYNSDIFSRCEGRLQRKETMESSSVCLSVAGYCNSISTGHSLLTQQRAADGPEASTGSHWECSVKSQLTYTGSV